MDIRCWMEAGATGATSTVGTAAGAGVRGVGHSPGLPESIIAARDRSPGAAPIAEPGSEHDREIPGGFDRRGIEHGMLSAGHVRSRWAVAWRHAIAKLLSKLPGTRFKSRLTRRLLGVSMGENVGLAYGVFLDPYDPTMISFGKNVLVGFDTRIFIHAFTLTRQRVRPVKIGDNVMIGACCLIAPGVTIGDGASIAAGTVVSRSVPAGAMAYGNPMQLRRRKREV